MAAYYNYFWKLGTFADIGNGDWQEWFSYKGILVFVLFLFTDLAWLL
jgi:hypothetical protein